MGSSLSSMVKDPITILVLLGVLFSKQPRLTLISMLDIGVFFAVLMTGFAYVWKRGDLDWVRAVSHERSQSGPRLAEAEPSLEPALSA